ncbi:MAG: 50S ribosomal protein L32 [Parolsenella sp.]|uniref:50S ribosomal protein L32 n=1 Tax=Parolsenella sp. TaxID=2083006 RepID=UPI0015A07C31|nr:50S ribosomal protein L32 [Parolsenella sp.]MDD5894391.1 50S ribosomal protein L32 [Coriobacteriaceae bacterium]MDY2723090.1 50S ribosomal protein L32 [Coriobacteriales bacterium]MDD7204377.1 50S ribosomal protein L32 [Coriobacteriaceae bacterium]MDY3292451.1 50S ribosomal protein L32 [Parolsenella sp.]MDY5662715.1 50S ribosomal protein L32 [Coriobacteriales bacterium]
MAVPKRKTGRIRTHSRRSANDKCATIGRSICPQCGEVKRPHTVCPSCGYYKDREVLSVED